MKRIDDLLTGEQWQVGGEKPVYDCPLCEDTGVVFRGDIAYPCRCAKEKQLYIRKKRGGITPHLQKQTFAAFRLDLYSADDGDGARSHRENARRAKAGAEAFVADVIAGKETKGLLFEGSVGSGKTFLAAACANALTEAGIDVAFVVVPDLLSDLRETFNDGGLSEGEVMEAVKKAPVLILDDLGAHNYTDWSVKTIFALLNHRVNYEMPIVVTTNLDQRAIEEHLGSRVYSRLLEACRFYRMNVAKDIRMELRRQKKGRG